MSTKSQDRLLQALHLPPPDTDAQAISDALVTHIRQVMADNGGMLDFARFMELCLYAPGLGYYSAGMRKLGAGGDFVTAPEVSALFSRCVAMQCLQVLRTTGGDILEFGAGSGVMAADILLELEQQQALPPHYFILELSPDLKQRQQQTLKDKAPHLCDRVEWLNTLPESFTGVVLANEVLDAMPVHVFDIKNREACERNVTWSDDGFAWCDAKTANPELQTVMNALQQQFDLPEGYCSEINLAMRGWVTAVADMLKRGLVILIDYGYPQREYYHAQRNRGTLMCHYRHHAHEDPLILTGLQDITAHVDFTAVAECAADAGLEVAGFATQAHFLTNCGIESFLAGMSASDLQAVSAQVKKLVLPNAMGELFKVLALLKDVEEPAIGFTNFDMRSRL